MPEKETPQASEKKAKPHLSAGLKLRALLAPHWKQLTLAAVAVVGETAADLAQPWPLKIVLDYVLESKHMPDWLAAVVHRVAGTSQIAILDVAVFAVAVIALVGAVS